MVRTQARPTAPEEPYLVVLVSTWGFDHVVAIIDLLHVAGAVYDQSPVRAGCLPSFGSNAHACLQ